MCIISIWLAVSFQNTDSTLAHQEWTGLSDFESTRSTDLTFRLMDSPTFGSQDNAHFYNIQTPLQNQASKQRSPYKPRTGTRIVRERYGRRQRID